jgi:arginine/ornithine N-succinyltransferase beta subunit
MLLHDLDAIKHLLIGLKPLFFKLSFIVLENFEQGSSCNLQAQVKILVLIHNFTGPNQMCLEFVNSSLNSSNKGSTWT